MKSLVLLLLLSGQFARPEVYSGTVIYFDFAQDEITISADSKSNAVGANGQAFTHCKISAFGDKFVFVGTGFTFHAHVNPFGIPNVWSAHARARDAWGNAAASGLTDASALVTAVADKWASAMETHFGDPTLIRRLRAALVNSEQPIVGGLFAATDVSGHLTLIGVDVFMDLPVFDSTGKVKLWHEISHSYPDSWGTAGYDEIVNEFKRQTSPRSKEIMGRFLAEISALPPSEGRAKLAEKLIDLSILFHPKKELLGGPIDVLQLRRRKGVAWIQRKENCPKD